MTNANQTTIQSYDDHVKEYMEGTEQKVVGATKVWIDAILASVPHSARIIEIGAGAGRDAAYIEAEGYTIDRTDAAAGFVKAFQDKGHDARLLNVITDEIPTGYDVVFADAVLLHFTRAEVAMVANKVYGALSAGGRFTFSLIIGNGDRWTEGKLGSPRYFCYWQPNEIRELLRTAGFTNIKVVEDDKPYITARWMFITAQKGNYTPRP